MSLRYRRMKPEDIDACVHTIERHPFVGPTYDNNFTELARAWRTIQAEDACCAFVFEETTGNQVRLLGPAVWVAVNDKFAADIQRPPFRWVGPELARLINQGHSPVVSHQELRDNNSRSGINIVAWPSSPAPDDTSRMDVNHFIMQAFVQSVRGYQLKQIFSSPPLWMKQRRFFSGAPRWRPRLACARIFLS